MNPNPVAVDEVLIRTDSGGFGLYAAVVLAQLNLSILTRSPSKPTICAIFLRELRAKRHGDSALFSVDAGGRLTAARSRTSLRFRLACHGIRNASKHVFGEVKFRTYIFKYVWKRGADGGRVAAPSLRRLLGPTLDVTRSDVVALRLA